MDTIVPSLTIGIVTFKRVGKLRVLLSSLLVQTLLDFRVQIIHDGEDSQTFNLIEEFRNIANFEILYRETDVRFNDYGHSLREFIIEETSTPYLLLTNDDNYYMPTFVEELLNAMQDNHLDIAYCDMIHSHVFPESKDMANYQLLTTEPRRGKIDIGCFIVRSDIARKVGFKDKSFDGDATYFEECLTSHKSILIGKVKKVLFVHN